MQVGCSYGVSILEDFLKHSVCRDWKLNCRVCSDYEHHICIYNSIAETKTNSSLLYY